MPTDYPILDALTRGLDADVRQKAKRRAESLCRAMRFLEQKQDEKLRLVKTREWTTERLEAIFQLAAFYQTVLGPLVCAAMTETVLGVGRTVPIRHGSGDLFHEDWAKPFRAAFLDFKRSLEETEIALSWIEAATAEDIVFQISQRYRHDDK